MITADRWYDQHPDLTLYYQGDVIRDIPFPTFPPALPATREEVWPILRPMRLKGRTVEQAMSQLPNELIGRAAKDVEDVWTPPNGEWAAVHIKKQNVMMISRSCALDKPSRKHVLVAPVIAVATLPQQERGEDRLRDLRENNIPHFFYLPETERLPESFADLLVLTPIHRTFFPTASADSNTSSRQVVERCDGSPATSVVGALRRKIRVRPRRRMPSGRQVQMLELLPRRQRRCTEEQGCWPAVRDVRSVWRGSIVGEDARLNYRSRSIC